MAWALDLDGVVWRGTDGVPGSAEAVRLLQESGERVLFVTNNSGRRVVEVEANLMPTGPDNPYGNAHGVRETVIESEAQGARDGLVERVDERHLDLDRVQRVVKVLGMVNAEPTFVNHPGVINGFSDLMVEVFGEAGRAARSAVGMGSLPMNIPVEVEMIVEIKKT